jgi:hypothetical protein
MTSSYFLSPEVLLVSKIKMMIRLEPQPNCRIRTLNRFADSTREYIGEIFTGEFEYFYAPYDNYVPCCIYNIWYWVKK